MVPYPILHCLLLSYISGQATALFRPSGFSRVRPKVSQMKPPTFEMKPLKVDRKMETEVRASWGNGQKPGGKALETNLGGSKINGKLLPPVNEKKLDIFKEREPRLGEQTPGKYKMVLPPLVNIHRKESLDKTLESNLKNSKENGENLPHSNNQELDLSGTNEGELKKETPEKVKNDHPPHINHEGSLEKTLESNMKGSKHSPHENDHELDLSRTNEGELKKETLEKVKNDHPPHINHEGSLEKTLESNMEGSKHSPHKNDHDLDLSTTNEEELKTEMPEEVKNDHPPHSHIHHEGRLEKSLESNMESSKHLPHNSDHELDLSGRNEKELKEEKPEQVKNDYPPYIRIHPEESSDDDYYKTRNQENKKHSPKFQNRGILQRQAAAVGIFSSFRSFGFRPSVPKMKAFKFEMKPIKFEMKPPKFDSALFSRDAKLNFRKDELKPLLGNKNMNSRPGSSWWRKEQKSGIQETNFGGSENNGKLLPPMSDQHLEIFKAARRRLNARKNKAQTPKNGKNDPPPLTGIQREGSVEKTLESSKSNGKRPSNKNGHESDLSETNGKEVKVETPEKGKNGHHPHIHIPHHGSSEKTTESNLESIKKIGEHLPHKNDQELDLSKTNDKELKEETPEKVQNDQIPHINIHHQENSDDDDSKTRNPNYKKLILSSAMIQKSDNVASAGEIFSQGRTFDLMFYIIIGFVLIIIIFICFKKCRKPQRSDNFEGMLL